jgi:serine/threonine-protein kinase
MHPHVDDRRRRADALFARALELEAGHRAEYLEDACPDDPELRAEVEELLRLAASETPALEPGSLRVDRLWGDLAGEAAEESEAGRRLGPWRIVRPLGRGGMGMVYLAERADGQYRQLAALKLLGAGAGGREVLRRFERERQILASLSHANIARLLDGGETGDGRPFLVMEYVDGRPIDRYADEERLDVDDRLALVLEVGKAIQHAHRNLVIHRDVKPSNIAVTREGEVKLLDFGIAKLLSLGEAGGTRATRVVARVLTPEYASPEQVRGEAVTTASDIYQLGLLLSELLTGRRAQPLASTEPPALERALEEAVCRAPPVRPSVQVAASATPETCAARRTTRAALERRLRGDLDDIVLCALRKEPERRYLTVGELLDDLERHRRGLPIRARPDSLSYRGRKFVARHRQVLAWGLAAALGVLSVLALLAGQHLRTAREARHAAEVERLVGGLFALPNPRVHPRPPTARDYVDHAAHLVEDELRDQPASRARLLTLLGRTYNALGLYPASIDVLGRALALTEARDGTASPQVADVLRSLARSQYYDGRYETAERSLRRARRILRRARRILAAGPGARSAESLRVDLELGDLLHTRGRLTEAERLLRSALARLGDPAADRADRAAGLRDLGNVLRDRGAFREAESRYRESIDLFRAVYGDPDQQLSTAEVYYARLLILEGRPERAEPILVDNLAKLRRMYGGDHPLTGTVLRNLGYALLEEGRYDEAAARLDEAQRIFHKWLGPDHPMVLRARARQAELALRRGRVAQAAALARSAMDRFARLDLADHPEALDACTTLGQALLALGRRPEAATVLAPCRDAARRQYVAGDPRSALMDRLLARAGARAPGAAPASTPAAGAGAPR